MVQLSCPDVGARYIVLGAAIPLVLIITAFVKSKGKLPLPPGPKGRYPLLGLTFEMPKLKPWERFAMWANEYGPLIHFRVGLQHHIIISDGQIARDLLDKRSNIYSSRPYSIIGEIVSGNMRSVLLPYGDHWRQMRKIFASLLTAKKCDTYLHVQEAEALVTVHNLRSDPSQLFEEVHRYSLSVARQVAFGERVPSADDPFATDVTRTMTQFGAAMTPGKYAVESIHALSWLPRMLKPWMTELEEFREDESKFTLSNYQYALEQSKKWPDRASFARDISKEIKGTRWGSDLQAGTTCMEILGAGSDTTANSLLYMIMACATNPEVVRKAHEELDRVIGSDRLPSWSDEPNLPYIRAIVKEQHRWRSIAPMAFAHTAEKEDIYQGYRIPKGSIVRINTWAIQMDPNRYPEPEKFMPERFLEHSLGAAAYANSGNVAGRDHFSYGGGKRICVGLHLAERSLFTLTSRLLHAFDIKLALDSNGVEIPIETMANKTSLVMAPEPFEVRLVIRSDKIGKLFDEEYESRFGNAIVDNM